jgi:hypothetical protein
MVEAGKIAEFAAMLGTMITCYIYLWRADRGLVPKIRKITGLEMIPELVGRCVEMDKPIHCTTGTYGGLIEKEASVNLAGLSVMGYVCRIAAKLGARVIFSARLPEIYAAGRDIMKTSYTAEGHPEIEPDARYLPGSSFMVGTMSVFYSEGAAANVAIGLVTADCYYWTGAARDVGAIQVCGTDSFTQAPVLVTNCDYVLLGDECVAAGAITSGNPSQIAGLVGLDIAKQSMLIVLLLGVLTTTAGISTILDILNY